MPYSPPAYPVRLASRRPTIAEPQKSGTEARSGSHAAKGFACHQRAVAGGSADPVASATPQTQDGLSTLRDKAAHLASRNLGQRCGQLLFHAPSGHHPGDGPESTFSAAPTKAISTAGSVCNTKCLQDKTGLFGQDFEFMRQARCADLRFALTPGRRRIPAKEEAICCRPIPPAVGIAISRCPVKQNPT